MQKDIILKHCRETYYIDIQIDIIFRRAASPVCCIVFYSHSVICEAIAGCQFCKTWRKLSLCTTAQLRNLVWRSHLHILETFLLLSHYLQHPSPLDLEKCNSCSIGYKSRNRYTHPAHRMYPDTDTPAATALDNLHLPYLGIDNYLS